MQSIKRARVFGTRTAGGVLPAVLERLPGGDVLQDAIGDFTTAAGERIEGRGVIPRPSVIHAHAGGSCRGAQTPSSMRPWTGLLTRSVTDAASLVLRPS